MAFSDRELLARLIQCEAGGDNCTKAVASNDRALSYVLLKSIESGNLLYCDIYSIKFVIIAENSYTGRPDSDFQV